MTRRPSPSTSKPVKSRRRANHSANGRVKPASVSRRSARKGMSSRGRAHSNGHAGRNGQVRVKASKSSKLNLKAAMGVIAAAASGLAHSAETIKHQAAEKFTAILEKSKRSLSHIRSQAAKTFGAGTKPGASRASGRRARGVSSNNGNGHASQGAPSSVPTAIASASAD
ncbi:MAG: DUF4603 domain-containing protein [Phycisphaerales bacterium]|nr:DUF4603 domain-containing protein [Phycisphaerales bacterium]MCI0674657.1 DUF4603 domain-containing protein [Phycisphaerales bacterium]